MLSAQDVESQGDKARIDAILQVSVSANAELYEKVKGELSMCQAMEKLMEPEIRKARTDALAEGAMKGENKLGQLVLKLISLGRNQDIEKVANDPTYREQLYTELGIA